MNELENFAPKADFSSYESDDECYDVEVEKPLEDADYEGEILSAIGETDEELYALADEIGDEDTNYFKMKNTVTMDHSFAA